MGVNTYDPGAFQAELRSILANKPRFPEEDLYMRWYWGDKPTSRLAKRIINAHFNEKSMTIIVHGDPRIGKSGYVFKTMIQVYDYLYGIRDPLLLHRLILGYRPSEIMRMCRAIKRPIHWYSRFRKDKMPGLIWDDGGIWLFNKDWNKKSVKGISKYFQILFTKIDVMIITTPTPANLTKDVRAIPSAVWIEIRREEEDPEFLGVEPDYLRFGRNSRVYEPFMSADLRRLRVWKQFEEVFDCRFPDSVFNAYQPQREDYTMKEEDKLYFEMLATDKEEMLSEKKRMENLMKVLPDPIFAQ